MIYINAESTQPALLIKELEAAHCTIIVQRLAEPWEGRPPETLVVARHPEWSTALNRSLRRIAANHNQDCIAVRLSENVGLNVGSKPVAYKEEYFVIE